MELDQHLENSVFRSGITEEPTIRPLRMAVLIGFLYVLFFSLYIWISGKLAAIASESVGDLAGRELAKGLIFVLLTGTTLFFFTFFMFRGIERRNQTILTQYKLIIQNERFVVGGLFASSIAHDVSNLVSVVYGYSELLQRPGRTRDEDVQITSGLLAAGERLKKYTERLIEASRGYIPDEKTCTDIVPLVEDSIQFARTHQAVKSCRIEHESPRKLTATLNTALFGRVLMNLILNAAEATEGKGRLMVRLRDRRDAWVLEVHDDGPGIPIEIREKICDPFFTTKKTGSGLGLLSLKIFAAQHCADLEIIDSDLKGACIAVTVPKKQQTCTSGT